MVVSCLYKKFHSENSMRQPFQLQILSDTSYLSETSSEILRFVSSVRYNLSEILLNFFTLSRYYIRTFQQVPWFLDIVCYFLLFPNVRAQVCGQVSWSKYIKFEVLSPTCLSFDSITWISLSLSIILKFRPTCNYI